MRFGRLSSVVDRDALGAQRPSKSASATRLLHPLVADQLAILGQLSDAQRAELWSPQSDWELNDLSFCSYCPHCCLNDLASDRAPYGRQVWQQSWYTVCQPHGTALVLRSLVHLPKNRSCDVGVILREATVLGLLLSATGIHDADVRLTDPSARHDRPLVRRSSCDPHRRWSPDFDRVGRVGPYQCQRH
jgi:hypothetical protein